MKNIMLSLKKSVLSFLLLLQNDYSKAFIGDIKYAIITNNVGSTMIFD